MFHWALFLQKGVDQEILMGVKIGRWLGQWNISTLLNPTEVKK